jgi:hypothetical protein
MIERQIDRVPGSARVSRAGFGVAPKQSFSPTALGPSWQVLKKSSRSRGRARQHATRVRSPDVQLRLVRRVGIRQ